MMEGSWLKVRELIYWILSSDCWLILSKRLLRNQMITGTAASTKIHFNSIAHKGMAFDGFWGVLGEIGWNHNNIHQL